MKENAGQSENLTRNHGDIPLGKDFLFYCSSTFGISLFLNINIRLVIIFTITSELYRSPWMDLF